MPPIVVRYDRARALRGALAFWLVGLAAALISAWGAGAGRYPLAQWASRVGLSPALVAFCLILVPTTVAATYTVAHVLRRRNTVTLTSNGLEVRDSLGLYRVDWDNVSECGMYLASLAGVRVKDLAAVLESHRGTSRQRELLISREPIGGYHLTFGKHELDCGLETFVEFIERYRLNSGERDQLVG